MMAPAWPYLRRLWALLGAMVVGLAVTWLYSLASEQPLPHLRIAAQLLRDDGPWLAGLLFVLGAVSITAERAHRRHEARAPRPLQTAPQSRLRLFRRLKRSADAPAAVPSAQAASSTMVGRTAELARLNEWFAQVRSGTRQVIFVSGEPGIGKTTLTRAFLDSLANHGTVRIGRGQCVEQYGAGEPYMPILEALTRLCREPGGEKLVEILHRMAPAWLAQMPSLISAEDRARLQGLAQGTTQQRMLREMAEALEVIAAETPLVLFIEDLHWSDPSTLDLIATVARRNEPARLMILGTYRPVEMLAGEHPLRAMKEELELHQQAIELRLPLLSESDVAAYLTQRFSDDKEKIAAAVYARSEGNPLFMVNVVDYLIEQGSLADADKIEAPRSIRQMIERNLQRLTPDEQRILEAASVAGAEFSAAAVAAALERPIGEVDACCTHLSKREQFVTRLSSSTWPDGTSSTAFRFQHALYCDVLYHAIPESHRLGFHRLIADRMDAAYDGRVGEIAAELANHYRSAKETDKSTRFFQLAAEGAVQRCAYREGERHYRDALALLLTLPESSARDRQELALQNALAPSLAVTSGWAVPEVEIVHRRAVELSERLGGSSLQLPARWGLSVFYMLNGEHRQAVSQAKELVALAEAAEDPGSLLEAHLALGMCSFWVGELRDAHNHLEFAVSQYESHHHRGLASLYGATDPGVMSLSYLAWDLWLMGYPDSALRRTEKALELGRQPSQIFSGAMALSHGAWLYNLRREPKQAQECAETAIALSNESGFPFWLAESTIWRGCAMVQRRQEAIGIAQILEGRSSWQATGAKVADGYILIQIAEARGRMGDLTEAQAVASRAIESARQTSELVYLPEFYRIKGELLLQRDDSATGEASSCFEYAIEVAQQQGAKSLELRATTSLARLLRDTGRREEARTMLAEIYGWFTEGFDTKDLKDAKSLLDDLGRVAG
jgi:predicted ATPase